MIRAFIKSIFIALSKRFKFIERYYNNSAFLRIPVGITIVNFIVQRLFFVNSGTRIPVHFTSRVTAYKKIKLHKDKTTRISFAVSGNVYIQGINGIEIGKNFLFAPGVKIISANHNQVEGGHIEVSPIKIGNDVWLGTNVIILPSVSIGDNCIVAAGAVVTKSFPENSIIAGNPAKLLKTNNVKKTENE